MKTIATAALCACLVFGAGAVSAQGTTPASKQAAKVTQDCKDRTATQMGEKRIDANLSSDVAKACADAPMKAASHAKRQHRKAMKHGAAASSAM